MYVCACACARGRGLCIRGAEESKEERSRIVLVEGLGCRVESLGFRGGAEGSKEERSGIVVVDQGVLFLLDCSM